VISLQLVVAFVGAWLQREQQETIEYLREENRVLRAQLRERRLLLTDDERRRLAVHGARLGRKVLNRVATIVTPETILRWHRLVLRRNSRRTPVQPVLVMQTREN
jgi:hypothetical protein